MGVLLELLYLGRPTGEFKGKNTMYFVLLYRCFSLVEKNERP